MRATTNELSVVEWELQPTLLAILLFCAASHYGGGGWPEDLLKTILVKDDASCRHHLQRIYSFGLSL